jgi:hypothetical protein
MGSSMPHARGVHILRLHFPSPWLVSQYSHNPIVLDKRWIRLRGNAWVNRDGEGMWIEGIIMGATADEVEEILEAATWGVSQLYLATGSTKHAAVLDTLRDTILIKRQMERRSFT